MQDLHIVLYTLQYSYVHGAEKENLSNNQKFLEVIIISVILVTLKLASRVMLLEEIRCLSLRGVNWGLTEVNCYFETILWLLILGVFSRLHWYFHYILKQSGFFLF